MADLAVQHLSKRAKDRVLPGTSSGKPADTLPDFELRRNYGSTLLEENNHLLRNHEHTQSTSDQQK